LALIAASDSPGKWEAPADCTAARNAVPPYAELAKELQYDRNAPLDVHLLSSADEQGVKL
jgi:hypothetical protein